MNVCIRPWVDEDALALYQMSMHPYYIKKRIWKYLYPDTFLRALTTIHFYQSADPKRFIYRAIVDEQGACGYIQCEKKGTGIGEISYWLDVSKWYKGIMKEALLYLCKEVFEDTTMLQVYARVEKENVASLHVLLACGFQMEEHDDLHIFRKYR